MKHKEINQGIEVTAIKEQSDIKKKSTGGRQNETRTNSLNTEVNAQQNETLNLKKKWYNLGENDRDHQTE